MTELVRAVLAEAERGEAQHGGYASMHEAFAVLLEEVDELKAEVWKRAHDRNLAALQNEAIQVAAVALRMAATASESRHAVR
jgi:NTP pyrophosphatase (non-canonical NTP hydrolase)